LGSKETVKQATYGGGRGERERDRERKRERGRETERERERERERDRERESLFFVALGDKTQGLAQARPVLYLGHLPSLRLLIVRII
jgi:hypothetical protein